MNLSAKHGIYKPLNQVTKSNSWTDTDNPTSSSPQLPTSSRWSSTSSRPCITSAIVTRISYTSSTSTRHGITSFASEGSRISTCYENVRRVTRSSWTKRVSTSKTCSTPWLSTKCFEVKNNKWMLWIAKYNRLIGYGEVKLRTRGNYNLIMKIIFRSPRSPLMLRGNFSPTMRPANFSPNSPIRFRRGVMMPGRPGVYGPRPRMFAAASAARLAVRYRMPTIASVDSTGIMNYWQTKHLII